MVAKKKPNRVEPAVSTRVDTGRRKPKSKKSRPISENPAAGLALLHRARRGR